MKSGSRFTSIVMGVALLIALGVTVQAQNREKFVISAKAGGVNLVSGNVTVVRQGQQSQEALTSNDNLETGDMVTTGAGGRVEVLLNPGTYLRVDENSEFMLTDSSLENLRVKLEKGSALVEATGDDYTALNIRFTLPQTEARIVKRGIYRFNVLPNGTTEIVVRKGRAFYDASAMNLINIEVKEGHKVIIGNGQTEVVKLDKTEDAFDLWSKQRAEFLAKANQQIQPRTLLTAFNNYYWPDLYGFDSGYGLGSGYGFYNAGFWFYNPAFRGYCFVPRGQRNWTSPYGHQYRTGITPWNPGGGGGWTHRHNSQPGSSGSSLTSGNSRSASSSRSSNSSAGNSSGSWSGNSNPGLASQPASQPSYSPPAMSSSAPSHVTATGGTAARSPQ